MPPSPLERHTLVIVPQIPALSDFDPPIGNFRITISDFWITISESDNLVVQPVGRHSAKPAIPLLVLSLQCPIFECQFLASKTA
jgi:hypothetical protein